MLHYKKAVEMETCNFIDNSAKPQGMAPLEFLRKLCDGTVGVALTLRTLGKNNPRVDRTLEACIQGYIVYTLPRSGIGWRIWVFPWSWRLRSVPRSCCNKAMSERMVLISG